MADAPTFDDFPPIDSDYLDSNPLSFSFDDLEFPLDDFLLLSPDSALSFPSPDSAANSSGSADPDHPPPTPAPKPTSSSSSRDSADVPAVSSIRLDPIKSEDDAASSGKRKMGGDGSDSVVRVAKLHRSSGGDDGKKQARLMRNRESAQLSRQRKKHYVEELEERVRLLGTAVAELNGKLSYVVAENATLRQQLAAAITGGGGAAGVVVQPIYPPPMAAAVPMPWIPAAAPFVVKAQGSQVPLVPIPRIKPQQPASAPKAKRADGGKTKKVASVSLLGLLFFILLFGGLVPIVNVRYGSITDLSRVDYGNGVFGSKPKGRVLAVKGPVNVDKCGGGGKGDQKEPNWMRNASEPLSASLYVPRNDKLVKIDGNLIIHSVLASEKAVANSKSSKRVSGRDSVRGNVKGDGREKTDLAIARSLGSALAVSASGVDVQRRPGYYRKHTEKLRAIGSGSGDRYDGQGKSNAAEGPLQEWFREGLAGPIMRSGMCTEVFQFEVSSNSGAIVSVNSVVNASGSHSGYSTSSKNKSRRFLHRAIPLPGSAFNRTRESTGKSTGENKLHGNESVSSSMVVSVLMDPRDPGVGESRVPPKSKSLSRIFVVVLLDSVKYATYSCVLPFKGFAPHLVAN